MIKIHEQTIANILAKAKQYSTDYNFSFDIRATIEEMIKKDELEEWDISVIYIDLGNLITDAATKEREVKLGWIACRGMDEAIGEQLSDCEAHKHRLEKLEGDVYNLAFDYGKKNPKLFPYLYNIAIWQPSDPRE